MDCNCTPNVESPISLCLSIAAIIISIMAILIDKHGYRSQLRVDFFSDHFKEALSKKIPEARNKLHFEHERLTEYIELQDTLADMRRGADYFKYANPWFYWWFKHRNQAAEDFVSKGITKNHDDVRQRRYLAKMDRKLHRLYRTITRKYFG